MTYGGMTLDEWIAYGCKAGKIKDVLTVIWAYSLTESDAENWVAAIVTGETTERAALIGVKSDVPTAYSLATIDWIGFNTLTGQCL